MGKEQLALPCITGWVLQPQLPFLLGWGRGGGKGTPTTFCLNTCEGFGGNPSLHALFESPAFESDLHREVVFFLKKDM